MAIERRHLPVGKGFDPENQQHVDVVMKKLAERDLGTGWKIQSFDPETGQLTVSRRGLLTQVAKEKRGATASYRVELYDGIKASDGEKIAAELESDPAHAGYFMTKFDPYLAQATLSKLTTEERRARGAVATALGVKPWEVQVKELPNGGFDVELPRQYVPSKFDVKLEEVASQIVGKPGWYWEADPANMRGQIIPGELPTFPPAYPFDFSTLPNGEPSEDELWKIPLGVALGGRGTPNHEVSMDLSGTVGALLVGLAGSGKSVATQGIVFNGLARGWELALINTADKATDFAWAKPFVRAGMWGCDNVAQAVAVAKLVGEEGERRGRLLSEYGVSKLQDLPKHVRDENPPLLVVADELAALLTADPLPPGLSKEMKELPEFMRMQQDLLESKLLATSLSTLPAVYRAAGIRVLYLTQQPSERYGFSAKLKGNLPHRIMLGTTPSEGEKANAFRTPEKIPSVPPNIAEDEKTARGVGIAHLDGVAPTIFKGYFAPLDTYLREAERRGFPTTLSPAPSEKDVERLVPRIDGGNAGGAVGEPVPSKDPAPKYGATPKKYEDWELDPETGKPLDPFQRANMARHLLAQS